MKNPMTGERTHRECLKDAELDPAELLEGQDECSMTEQNLDGNTLTFTMVCGGGSGTAKGRMFVDGDHGGGEIDHALRHGRPADGHDHELGCRPHRGLLSLARRGLAALCRAAGARCAAGPAAGLAAWRLRRTRPRADRGLRPADPGARRAPGRDRRPDRGRGRGDRALPRDRAGRRKQRALDHLPLRRPRPAAGPPAHHRRHHRSGRAFRDPALPAARVLARPLSRPRTGRGRREHAPAARRRPRRAPAALSGRSWRSTPPRWAASTACSRSATRWSTASSARSTWRSAGSPWSAPTRPSSRSRSSP